jgi:dUTP pyrophosphatase
MQNIRIKRLRPEVTVPSYAHAGDAGLDVFACDDYSLAPGERHVFDLGFAAEVPDGFVALVWDRSGLAVEHGIRSLAGVIDASYRGEWKIVLLNTSDEPWRVSKGDKIAQVLIQPVEQVIIKEVDSLSETKRGDGWKGSTGH